MEKSLLMEKPEAEESLQQEINKQTNNKKQAQRRKKDYHSVKKRKKTSIISLGIWENFLLKLSRIYPLTRLINVM